MELGLRANAAQFALLMLINAFVGGMVGLERTRFFPRQLSSLLREVPRAPCARTDRLRLRRK